MAALPNNSDLIELLSSLVEDRIRFLVVGGHAVAKHGEPRYTKDVDLWIDNSIKNATQVFQTLRDFGAPIATITPEFFTFDDHFLKLGKEPFRVDIICGMEGLTFADAWKRKVCGDLFGVKTWFISIGDLIRLKTIAGRPQDNLDVQRLRAQLRSKKT